MLQGKACGRFLHLTKHGFIHSLLLQKKIIIHPYVFCSKVIENNPFHNGFHQHENEMENSNFKSFSSE